MSAPHYRDDAVTLWHGDCLDVLRELPDNSVDSVVTDPPYGLANTTPRQVADTLTRWLAGERDYIPSGRGFMGKTWDAFVPPLAVWDECLRVLKPGGYVLSFAGTRTLDLVGIGLRLAGFDIRDGIGYGHQQVPVLAWVHGQGFPKGKSQLKPAWEPIIMGRKPFPGSESANVLAHGTGALNIDGTRVGDGSDKDDARWYGFAQKADSIMAPSGGMHTPGRLQPPKDPNAPAGRWPTNVVLDDTAAAELDEQTVTLSSHNGKGSFSTGASVGYEGGWGANSGQGYGDSGGASRFFPVFRYQAKAPTRERPKVDGVAHPTVKPLELMRWLVRLVTPPGGTVLEPFAGSGTTVEAALLEGFRCVAIEREADYLPLILQRIHRRQLPREEVAAPPASATPKPLDEPAPEPAPGQLGLFTEDVA